MKKREQAFLDTMRQLGFPVFSSQEANFFWGSSENTDNALSRMVKKGILVRLSRGLYAVVPILQDQFHLQLMIVPHLVKNAALAYGSAMRFYGFEPLTDHHICYIQSTHRKNEIFILDSKYLFVMVKPSQFFDVQFHHWQEHFRVSVTSLEKTLIDGLTHPEHAYGIAEIARFLRLFHQKINWDRTDALLQQLNNGAVLKRLAYLIDYLQLPIDSREERLARWQDHLTQGIVPLEPKKINQGSIRSHWAIEDNVFHLKRCLE